MNIQQILNETIENLLPNDSILKYEYAEDIWEMIQRAYEPIGGIKGSGFNDIDDMVENIPFWKVSIRNGVPNAVLMYKDRNGRKRVAMATDGTREAKKDISSMIIDEYKTKRAYAEISGASMRFHQKILGDEFDTISIPAADAIKMFSDSEVRLLPGEEYDYERNINGEWLVKRMVGNPKSSRIK